MDTLDVHSVVREIPVGIGCNDRQEHLQSRDIWRLGWLGVINCVRTWMRWSCRDTSNYLNLEEQKAMIEKEQHRGLQFSFVTINGWSRRSRGCTSRSLVKVVIFLENHSLPGSLQDIALHLHSGQRIA